MPHLDDDSRQALLETGQRAQSRAKKVWSDFTDFALRDNVS